jgi:hypothetical protein
MLFMLIDFGYKHEHGISSRISTPPPVQLLFYRYKPFIAYAHSKLANILHTNELSRRFQVCNLPPCRWLHIHIIARQKTCLVPFQEEGCNLTANSLHPGVIITNIIRYVAGNSNDVASSDLSKKI